jgi:hypothetical protein
MYLAKSTRPDIAFVVNLLARHSAAPTKRHWTEAKQILRYLNATKYLGLFFHKIEILAWLDTLMLAICLIPTMPDHRHILCSLMENCYIMNVI